MTIENDRGYLFIRIPNVGLRKIYLKEILYLTVNKHRTVFILEKTDPIYTAKKLEKFLVISSYGNFIRVHRSYYVNVDKIIEINSNSVLLTNRTQLPLSSRNKKKLLESITVL